MAFSIKIIPFHNKHQFHIDQLMQKISEEFSEPIFSASSIQMKNAAKVIGNQFWVAMDHEKLIGTIGMIRIKNKAGALKSMFVAKENRGGEVANFLLQKLLSYAKRKSMNVIYLGTMEQMKGAQKFYEKNGFDRVEEGELPKDFPKNPLDVIFYRRTMK